MTGRLGPPERERALERLRTETFDIVVIGGGVTGCGIALDATSRGLSVALLEMRDWAAGTSSRSGKLIHGGLRYLEQLNIGLVREALRERALMLTTLCPHLVRPLRFIYPLRHRVWERFYVGAGLALYDVLGGAGAVPRHRHLSRKAALALAPALRPDGIAGAISFYDAVVDDARHTLAVARTAVAHGAVAASAARVVGFERSAETGRISSVRVRDASTGDVFTVRARHVVNASGVWTDEVQRLVGGTAAFHVRASKGVHILVPRERIAAQAAILIRAEDSVVFARPWGRSWLIGTTDTPWDLDLDHPAANASDVAYLLRQMNRVLRDPLTPDDVLGVYAGLRPLLAGETETTSKLSREHAVASPEPGLTVVGGGKYTTYRVMAQDAVDVAARDLETTRPVPPSRTKRIALIGAESFWRCESAKAQTADEYGLTVEQVDRLLRRHGALIADVLGLAAGRPDLLRPIIGASDYLRAEAVYAASHEGALHLEDVLSRRTHISIETPDRGVNAAAEVAELMGGVLTWDGKTRALEVERYRRRVRAEVASQALPDDSAADAARKVVRDPRVDTGR